MRILTLGGTGFLSGAVVAAAQSRGHEVTTVTRGRHGEPPSGARSLHADRDDADALVPVAGAAAPEAVIDVCGYTVRGARASAEALAHVATYAYVSSISAYRSWPPGPVRSEQDPLWGPDDDLEAYGPMKAESERVLGRALGDRLLAARVGLIIGPGDRTRRLTSWLHRIATEEQVVVPADLEQPMSFIDARDVAAFLVAAAENHSSGAVTVTGPVGMTTLGGLLEACCEAVARAGDRPARLVPVPEEQLLAAGIEPWTDLPFWLPRDVATTAWQVDTARARSLGLEVRPITESVTDTWRWVQESGLDHAPVKPSWRQAS